MNRAIKLLPLIPLLLLSACTNSLQKISSTSPIGTPATNNPIGVKISAISIPNPSPSATPSASGPTATMTFDLAQSDTVITNYCSAPSSSSETSTTPCLCQYYWLEVNSTNGASVNVRRLEHTAPTAIQNGALQCPAPSEYSGISDATDIQVTVIPAPGNPNSFTINAYTFTKNKAALSNGAFKDSLGRSFVNILRYSCHEQVYRGMSIASKLNQLTSPYGQPEYLYAPSASLFCVQKTTDTTVPEGCVGGTLDYSAEAFYYNLYVKESEVGEINEGNARYVCPRVKESLRRVVGNIGTEGKYWPLDATFSLSFAKTNDFPVGVVANVKTSNPNDPSAVATTCSNTTGSSVSGNALLTGCLGYAARPDATGRCPTLTKADGVTPLKTYRLRRYFTLYPQQYDSDGTPIREARALDTIYVLDRPVAAPGGAEYTMQGPKPCPFAYFDHKAVRTNAAGVKAYAATNDTGWTGVNIDGLQYPNTDSANSCSAAIPILSADRTTMAYTTVNSSRTDQYKNVYIRPTTAWAPHYVEDESFLACAPQADPFVDPPLHFETTAGGNQAWCAEAYPTQNPNTTALDAGGPAVTPFTSHSKAGTCSFSNDINVTISARHAAAPNTCDRTVLTGTAGMNWLKYPLLAPATEVQSALAADTTYNCTVTYDVDGTKMGTKSPSGGCCNGLTLNGASTVENKHIEPGTSCMSPTY